MARRKSQKAEPSDEHLVAFCDIIGTSELVRTGNLSLFVPYDFVNPAGIVAGGCPSLRVAAFSDSVVLAAPLSETTNFISAVSFMMTQWLADRILVRGGISLGALRWFDDEGTDSMFRRFPNLSFARLFGPGLVEAHDLEARSGPGAALHVGESAARFLETRGANYLSSGRRRILNWLTESVRARLPAHLEAMRKDPESSGERKRQVDATIDHLARLKDVPGYDDEFIYQFMPKAPGYREEGARSLPNALPLKRTVGRGRPSRRLTAERSADDV